MMCLGGKHLFGVAINVRMILSGMLLILDHADPHKARPFEERIDLSHLGEGFNPGHAGQFTTTANERTGQTGSAIFGMQHRSEERV